MRLLTKNDYDKTEKLLRNYKKLQDTNIILEETYKLAMKEIIEFFNIPIYKEFIQLFYFTRDDYKNRYPDNRAMIQYLCEKLYSSEPQLYLVRKEIIYKSAMIFYKYNILGERS